MSFRKDNPGVDLGPESNTPPQPWLGPPHGEIPGEVAGPFVLARTEDVAIVIGGIRAYSTGFTFDMTIRLRQTPSEGHLAEMLRRRSTTDQGRADTFRLGVRFTDGLVAGMPVPTAAQTSEPPEVVLRPSRSTATDTEWDGRYWVWPLPRRGALAWVCTWPVYRIGDATVEVDARAIAHAAAEVVPLW